jgi:hypothetical protein
MPNLRAAAHARLATQILATLGEDATFLSKVGGPQAVTAAIDHVGNFDVTAQGRDIDEVLRVFVLRDPADATYGGIADPQIGDGFTIGREADGKVYTFTGEKRDVTQYSWALMFARRLPYSRGGGR